MGRAVQPRQLPDSADHEQQLGEGGGVRATGVGQGPKAPPLPAHSPSRTFSSLWPTYMLMSSGPFTLSDRMDE